MILEDDRTPEQKSWLICLMTDRFMSGWGQAKGAMRVRLVLGSYRPPSGAGHCHIYVWNGKERQ